MSNNVVISIQDISKIYRLGEVGTGSLAHDINRWVYRICGKEDPYTQAGQINDRTKKVEGDWVWALKDINLEVKEGEVLGIIGRNGAGKSTLLKILSRVTAPTTGEVRVKGRIAALLEVGTGFHPELTGRENIYLNGTILGLRKKQIDQRLDGIVDFSGCEAYLDTPVKRYSSGMQVRVAFAVAAHLDPEILVIDEVLAVGDAAFQKKCLGKMQDVAREGRTVLFVSHNLAAVTHLCPRAILIANGRLVMDGSNSTVIGAYLSDGQTLGGDLANVTARKGNGQIRAQRIRIYDSNRQPLESVCAGQRIDIEIDFECVEKAYPGGVTVGLSIGTGLGTPVTLIHNRLTGVEFEQLPKRGTFVCSIDKVPFTPSAYSLSLCIMPSWGVCEADYYDFVENALDLLVIEGDFYGTGRGITSGQGIMMADCGWSIRPREE